MASSRENVDHVILGAEKQAAVSAAIAFPEKNFLFLTDHEVVDGWDLKNVSIEYADPKELANRKKVENEGIPVCSRWVEEYAGAFTILNELHESFQDLTLPLFKSPPHEAWIKKGDRFHKPDAVETGIGEDPARKDPYGCGVLYQPLLQDIDAHFQVIGRRGAEGVAFGIIKVHREAFRREPFLIAGETVIDKELQEHTLSILEHVDPEGPFTMNWVHSPSFGLRMTSYRPIPKAVFSTLRAAGVDLIEREREENKGIRIATEGKKFVVEQHYASYYPLLEGASSFRRKKVLLLSATASAINFIHSLKDEEDIELHVTDTDPCASGLFYDNVIPHMIAPARDLDRYQKDLDDILRKNDIDCLIPTSDHDMEGVTRLRSKKGWDPLVHMFRPDPEVYEICSHKARLIRALQKKEDKPVPRIYSDEEIPAFPCILKPTREGGGKDVWIIENQEELQLRKRVLKQKWGDDLIVQEYIPGGTGSIYILVLLYGNEGELIESRVTHSTLTSMTWGGGGNAGEVVEEPDIERMGKQMIEYLGGWSGPVNLEFKKDSYTGSIKLMEINCRLNGYSYLLTMNDIDLPKKMINILFEGSSKPSIKKDGKKNFVLGFREMEIKEWNA